MGICGSGSFAISAAKIDPRMKVVATVSMYDMGAANRNALNRSQSLEERKKIIAEAAEPKRLVVVPNAGHVDLYDRVNLIPFDKLTLFFKAHLK